MKKYLVPLLLLPLVGCSSCTEANTESSVMQESKQTEANHKKLVKAVPPPAFETSLEREMLVKRLKLLNVQNKVMYIYCLSLDGKVIYSGVVQGKVSSLNSLLTTPDQIIAFRDGGGSWKFEKMPSPDFDGSYGKNPEGVFWFDPNGTYHEWSGTYFLSDRPVKVNTPISLQANVDPEKK